MKSVSPSQMQSFLLCPRLWWATRVKRWPTIDKGHGIFGTVLHGVMERYLNADDRGRDPVSGKPVELYPQGWHIARNRYTNEAEGFVNVDQQLHIKTLVEHAIEAGFVKRWPDRRVEVKMDRPVIGNLRTESYIDVLLPGAVIDFKTTKSISRYGKGPEAIKTDDQLLFYAYEAHCRNPKLTEIDISHIYFSKDPDEKVQVKMVGGSVGVEDVLSNWKFVVETTKKMVYLETFGPNQPWFEVEGPEDANKSCMAYGGCDFRPVCYHKESIEAYKKRVDRILANKPKMLGSPEPTNTQKEASKAMGKLFDSLMDGVDEEAVETKPKAAATAKKAGMSLKDRLKAGKAAKPAEEEPAKPAKGKASKPAEEPSGGIPMDEDGMVVNGTVRAYEAAPWADPSCPACHGAGFNSKGSQCRICCGRAAAKKTCNPDDWTMELDGDGILMFLPKGTASEEAEVEDEVVEDEAAEESGEEIEEEAEPEDSGADVEPEPAPAKRGPGRPRRNAGNAAAKPAAKLPAMGSKPSQKASPKKASSVRTGGMPILYIGCLPQGHEGQEATAEALFVQAASELGGDVAGYYKLDTWDRRAAFHKAGQDLMDGLVGNYDHIIANTNDPDVAAFVEAIKPYCMKVFGLARV